MESASAPARPPQPRIWARLVLFAFIAWVVYLGVGLLLYFLGAGTLITGIAASFMAAAVANGVTLRIYERGKLEDIGLDLSQSALYNGGLGFAGGLAAAALVGFVPVITGLASFTPAPPQPNPVLSFAFIAVGLLFGAIGEEMLFRGYAFQMLLKRWGPFSTILPMAVIFAWGHANNPETSWLALGNTFAWGVLLGFCFLRSGDLWLPIGVHFGWNFTLPLFGTNLSGHTMSVTGYSMSWNAGPVWSGGGYGLEGSVFTLLVLPLVGLYLWKAPVRVRKPFLLSGPEEES